MAEEPAAEPHGTGGGNALHQWAVLWWPCGGASADHAVGLLRAGCGHSRVQLCQPEAAWGKRLWLVWKMWVYTVISVCPTLSLWHEQKITTLTLALSWRLFKWALSNFVWCQLLFSLNLSYSFVDRCVCFLHRTTMPCISSLSLSTCVSVVTKVLMSVGLCCLLPEITPAFVAECSGDCPLMPWFLIKMEKMCHCV